MNFQTNFEQMSIAELEAESDRLLREKNVLEANRQEREDQLRRAQDASQTLREAAQDLIEQLTAALMPDLSPQTLYKIQQLFPGEADLIEKLQTEKSYEKVTTQEKISRFFQKLFGNNSAAKLLEQRRVLLRDALWRLSSVPNRSGNHADQFRALLEKKRESAVQEKTVNQREAEANKLEENFKNLQTELAACEKAIARRKTAHQTAEQSPLHNQTSDADDSFFDSDSDSSSVFNGSSASSSNTSFETNFDSSSDVSSETASTADDFSFGGGSDAGGGGAGGSWENYS